MAVSLPNPSVDPVLAAVLRAPIDDVPESDDEREAVRVAKASGRMIAHAHVETAIEAFLGGE